ncbi:hypothetical protein [Niallia oryzisoli]|uniref:hypothetical protein n=1 Tax=Niallia oryzisoli TaxID=1737571 RepID=UPI0037357B63
MATGREIKEVYDMMKRIYEETSKLVTVVNDLLEKEGYIAVGDGSVMWGRSSHYRSPNYWLPYFMQRVFVKEKDSKKGIGVNITFDSSMDGLENNVPFLTCGYLEFQKDKVVKGNGLYMAGWTEHPEAKKQMDGNLCTTNYNDGVMTKTYFLPLDLLTNQVKVNQYIIQPLVHLYKGEYSKASSVVSDVAIGIEDIIGVRKPF